MKTINVLLDTNVFISHSYDFDNGSLENLRNENKRVKKYSCVFVFIFIK